MRSQNGEQEERSLQNPSTTASAHDGTTTTNNNGGDDSHHHQHKSQQEEAMNGTAVASPVTTKNDVVAAGASSIEVQRAKAFFLYKEETCPGLRIELDMTRVLCSTESQFQKIDVLETRTFGKVGVE